MAGIEKVRISAVVILMALVASSCGYDPRPSEQKILAKGWLPHAEPYAVRAAKQPPTYCYRTLAEVDCHSYPLDPPEGDRRLVGADEGRPALVVQELPPPPGSSSL